MSWNLILTRFKALCIPAENIRKPEGSLMFPRVIDKAWSIIKKRLQNKCLPVNIAKFLRTPNLKDICERLLLKKGCSDTLRSKFYFMLLMFFYTPWNHQNTSTFQGVQKENSDMKWVNVFYTRSWMRNQALYFKIQTLFSVSTKCKASTANSRRTRNLALNS